MDQTLGRAKLTSSSILTFLFSSWEGLLYIGVEKGELDNKMLQPIREIVRWCASLSEKKTKKNFKNLLCVKYYRKVRTYFEEL